jgi:hypothetical protein
METPRKLRGDRVFQLSAGSRSKGEATATCRTRGHRGSIVQRRAQPRWTVVPQQWSRSQSRSLSMRQTLTRTNVRIKASDQTGTKLAQVPSRDHQQRSKRLRGIKTDQSLRAGSGKQERSQLLATRGAQLIPTGLLLLIPIETEIKIRLRDAGHEPHAVRTGRLLDVQQDVVNGH